MFNDFLKTTSISKNLDSNITELISPVTYATSLNISSYENGVWKVPVVVHSLMPFITTSKELRVKTENINKSLCKNASTCKPRTTSNIQIQNQFFIKSFTYKDENQQIVILVPDYNLDDITGLL